MGLTGQPLPALALIHLLSCCRNPFLNTWGSLAASYKGEKLPSSGGVGISLPGGVCSLVQWLCCCDKRLFGI